MIIDKALQVSNEQAVTATAASTDVIDFGQVNPNVGQSAAYMVITIDVSFATATSLAFAIEDSADNSTFASAITTPTIVIATLVAGHQIVIPMPTRLRRYVRCYYTVTGTNASAGKVSAQVVAGFQQNAAYPDSSRIS